MKKKIKFPKNGLGKRIHYCGGGFKGEVVKARGITFCGFCGHEFKE